MPKPGPDVLLPMALSMAAGLYFHLQRDLTGRPLEPMDVFLVKSHDATIAVLALVMATRRVLEDTPMSKPDKLVCKVLAVYALIVAANEWRTYGATWCFGADGWPEPMPGADLGAALGHNKAFLQLALTAIVVLALVGWFKGRRARRRRAAEMEFYAALERTKTMPRHLVDEACRHAADEYGRKI